MTDITQGNGLESTPAPGQPVADAGELVVTASKEPAADLGEIVITAPKFTANPAQQPIGNPLNDYDSYTYCLSLHLLSIDRGPYSYNKIIENPGSYVPQNVLVSSAGRWDPLTFVRDPSFTEDFYFDDFKMKTVVNTTARNRNTNLIECSFTIIEPLGFTFINRLIEAGSRINPGAGNYTSMPYVLQIDFLGSQDGTGGTTTGQTGIIKDLTKIIPIRFVTVKSKVTSRGTEYQIQAVPFNHQAFNQSVVTNPAACSITGKTVQDIFGQGTPDASYASSIAQYNKLNAERSELTAFVQQGQNIGGQEGSAQDYYNAKTRLSAVTNQIETQYTNLNVAGFCNAINGWYASLQKSKQILEVNTIKVEFHPDIGKADLFPNSGPVNIPQVPVSGNTEKDKKTAIQAAAGAAKSQIEFNGTTMNVPAGTTVDKLIDWAVRNSAYIGDQLNVPGSLRKKVRQGADPYGSPLKWYKIVPKVKILAYDSSTNKYTFDVIYYVKPYTLSTIYPFAPQGRIPGSVKRYDYIFTGQNKDVIDCQIDFDMLYYVELTASSIKDSISKTGSTVGEKNTNPVDPDPADTPKPESVPAHPVSSVYVSGSTQTMARSGGDPNMAEKAGDAERNLMLGARGDMISVSLKIIGDPQFIKQDDIFYGQDASTRSEQFINNNPNKSLWMDGGELYVFLNFRSPVDYDETLGIAPVKGKYQTSAFTGVYKVITVDNSLTRGKFEQTLTLAKLLLDQDGKPQPDALAERSDTLVRQALGPLVPNSAVRFVGPNINLNALNPSKNTQAALALAAGVATGGGSFLSGLVQQGVNAVVGKVVNKITSEISGAVSKAVTSATNSIGTSIEGIKYDVSGPSAGDLALADQADAYYNGTGDIVYADSFAAGDLDLSTDVLSADSVDVTELETIDTGSISDWWS